MWQAQPVRVDSTRKWSWRNMARGAETVSGGADPNFCGFARKPCTLGQVRCILGPRHKQNSDETNHDHQQGRRRGLFELLQ